MADKKAPGEVKMRCREVGNRGGVNMANRPEVFADWEGEAARVFYPGGDAPDVGVLEEVNDWGLVLRRGRWLSWSKKEGSRVQKDSEFRHVAEFHPWHMVSGVRLLEPEEKEEYGL
jgi:hypothetical protein